MVVAQRREFAVEVIEVSNGRVIARLLGDRPNQTEPAVSVTLLQAVLPNPDFDAVIEGGTAVGVSEFVAIQAERSVARPEARRRSRWESIASSAAEQSHRGQRPPIRGPLPLAEALAGPQMSRLLVLDPSSPSSLASAIDGSRHYRIAVGPEGGWTPQELSLMRDRGGITVNLGPRILRARLAPIVAAAILVQQP